MKGRFCWFVMIMMFLMRVIGRPLEPNTVLPPQQAGIAAQIMSFQSSMPSKTVTNSESSTRDEEVEMKNEEEEGYGRGGIENRIGSRPPSCDHKCYGCSPCEATEVPTTNHVGIQYTNYEPEGWKCKCGPTFYSP